MRSFILVIVFFLLGFVNQAQVNLQTGSPEQSFPLISYVDGKAGLSMSVGLTYSGGNGLMVNEVASNTGTGWNLNAGGFITRIQNGEPDDQEAWFGAAPGPGGKFWEYLNENPDYILKNYPAGFLFNPYRGAVCNAGLKYYPVFNRQALYKELNLVAADTEQDKFFLSVNGRSATFVIGKDLKATIIGDSRIKVAFSMIDMTALGIRTKINQFVVTTEDGIKYTFNERVLTHNCRYKVSRLNAKGEWEPYADEDNSAYAVSRMWGYKLPMDERPYVINSWLLKEIENPNTGQKIIFHYGNVQNDFISSTSVTHVRNLNEGSGGLPKDNKRGRDRFWRLSNPAVANAYTWNETWLNEFKAGPTSLFFSRSVALAKRLTSIQLPNGGFINFGYSNIPRIDLPGENALEKVSYLLNGVVIRSYQFEYGYLFKNSIRPYNSSFSSLEAKFARLCLLRMQKIGNAEDDATEPPYRFSYYTGSTFSADDIVPARNFLAQDHWGYYNGSNSGLSLTEDHDFLTNGRTQYFKSVLPRYKNPKNGFAKNGLLKSITYPTGGTIEYTYTQNLASSAILPSQYEQLAGGVSVSKVTVFDGEDHSKDIVTEYEYKNAQGQSSRWGDESPEYYSLTWTNLDHKGKKMGLSYPEAAVSPDIAKMLIKTAVIGIIRWGTQKMLAAMLPPPFNTIAIAIMITIDVYKAIVTMLTDAEFHRFAISNKNNMLANGMPALYSVVQVKTNSPTGYNGKTVYEFTNLSDYPALIPQLKWPYVPSQRLASWIYGLPKKVTVYDKDNLPVKETQNNYNYIVSKKADVFNQSCKCATVFKDDVKGYDWDEYHKAHFTGGEDWLTPQPYYIYTGRTDVASTQERAFTNGQEYYSAVTNTITDPMTLLQKGKIVQRDKYSVVIELTYYPTDYSIPGSAMERMVQTNAIHTPVATETWLIERDRNVPMLQRNVILNSVITEYKVYNFGSRQEVKPWKVWEMKSKQPISKIVFGNHNPSVLIRHPEYFQLKSEMIYDNDGNLVQTISDGNITSYVNDYRSRAVVATVANANFQDISYTSFEADGTGGWNFNAAAIKPSGSITGSKAFRLGFDPAISQTTTITRTGLDPAKTYVITYWLQNVEPDRAYINGLYGEVLFQQSSGWTLYKHEVTGVSQVTITGDALLDELRLYPKGALMSTVTYKDGIGKTTECDANNRLLYYEYDALGRIKLMRDQNRNIIKTYEYNFKH